jgi:S-(hydroxymethyl)glutathione dehydrogenase / alcohol dehydrogenase
MRAALLRRSGEEILSVTSSSTTSFGPGRVHIRMHRAALCHSDLSAMTGMVPHPAPFVPGHEGAGEVIAVGEGVTSVKPGDRVIVCWMPPCDSCWHCRAGQGHLCKSAYQNLATPNFEIDQTPVLGMLGGGTFADEVVLDAKSAIPVPDDVPYDVAAIIGCGVTTGIGAALNTARVQPGSTVVVIGLGGVGISIIQGAKVAGAARIVAVDPTASRREWAMKFGATLAIAPEELTEVGPEITDGVGFDYAFEAVGKAATLRAAYDAARIGGVVCLVGVGSDTETVPLGLAELMRGEKKILPSLYGGDDVRRTFATVIELWREGRIDLESMITHHVALSDINEAIRQMKTGEALRTVIDIAP